MSALLLILIAVGFVVQGVLWSRLVTLARAHELHAAEIQRVTDRVDVLQTPRPFKTSPGRVLLRQCLARHGKATS